MLLSITCSLVTSVDTADSSDHEGAAKAIAKGLISGHSKERPGYWLHTSGTGILCWKDMETETFGEAPSQEPYDDLEGVAKLTGLPNSAVHRDIDKIVLSAGAQNSDILKTAIVCPPTIYGLGRGASNKRSRQVYNLAKATLEKGKAPQLGKGLTEWDNVHIHDLAQLFVLLAEQASKNSQDLELWGEKGYFLAENGHHVWGEVSKEVAKAAYKADYISADGTEHMSVSDAKEAYGFEALSWGLNSKGYAKRARKYLGWKPQGKSLSQEIPDIVESEAKSLGLKPGHAKQVAGEV